MLYKIGIYTTGIAFIVGVVILWKPAVANGRRWIGGVAIGVAVIAGMLTPDYSGDVVEVRTPTEEMIVRKSPSESADTADAPHSSVEPGDELHVVADTSGFVGFRDDPADATWTGYLPSPKTEPLSAYQNRQARQDSLEEVREERAAERRASRVSEAEALNACEGFIEDKLKAPSTAEFGWAADAQFTRHDRTTMTVRSHVDAENAMGAKLRSEYRCKVAREGDTWKLLDLAMSQR